MGLLETLFGQIKWTPPAWIQRVGAKRLLPLLLAATSFGAVAVLCLHYYEPPPHPAQVVARVDPPGVTPIVNGLLRPEPLSIQFSVVSDPRLGMDTVNSVASLETLGDVVTRGVSIEPAIAGVWRWVSETELSFSPDRDWPAGQTYTVRYENRLFAPGLSLESDQIEFQTADFGVDIERLDFYQDPVQSELRKVVATLSFTHPVARESLDRYVSYTMRRSGTTIETDGEAVDYDITLEPLKRKAHIHSRPIDIPPEENYMTLHVADGLAPIAGPARLSTDLIRDVRIPDVSSYFKVSNVATILARDENDDSSQALTLRFTDRVSNERLAEHVSAWLLPADIVINGSARQGYRWQSPRQVTAATLAKAQPVPINLSATEHGSEILHSAPLDLKEGRYLYVRVDAGLHSDSGFVLARPYDTIVRIPNYPKEVKIAQSGAVLPLSSSHRLTFVSRGVSTLRVELGRLLDKDLNHLASQTSGDIRSPYFNNYRLTEDNITARTTRFVELNPKHPAKADFSSLDLTDHLPDGGFYFVSVQGWDRQNQHAIGPADRRFILVTDLGLLVKTSADGSHDVFVHSIATGQPVSGANIALLGKNGLPIAERRSSADGHAAMPPTNDFDREKTPTVFVVKNGRDSVFMPYARNGRRLQYSRFDTGGEYDQQRPDERKLRAEVFTDRGIYRPGDTVNLAAIVKRVDWGKLGNLPLALTVTDPRGQTVLDRRLSLPDAGLLDAQFATDAVAATGDYNATLFVVTDHKYRQSIGAAAFRVEEFLPDRLRIKSRIRGQKITGWIKPEELVCEVDLENLFGTAAQNRRVTGQLRLRPSSIRFSSHEGFVFRDPLRQPNASLQPVTQALAESKTDDLGRAELPLDLDRYDQGIYELRVLTEGFEQGGGRSVKAEARVMVSPLDYLVGHRTISDLGFIDLGSEHVIDYVAVDSDGKAISVASLELAILEYRYVSTLIQRPNGTYAYESVRKQSLASVQDYSIDAAGAQFSLPSESAGKYAVVIRDSAGLVFSKVDFTVAGARNLLGSLERDAELELNIDGTNFSTGDEIRFEISAPYAGTGLVTIERDRVYAHQWIHSDTNSSVHSIRIPPGLEGNAYINVAFVRELDSPEVYVSPLSYAVESFAVNHEARVVDIDLDTPALVRPGDELMITHRSSRPSRIIIYAVDEGILQVARYQLPNPLDTFLPKMALQVATHQMLDLILPDFDLYRRHAAPGGGEAAGLLGSNLNPFRRKTDAPVVFWSGVVDSGPTAGTLSYRVPDHFNGTLRVMAIAATDAAVGRGQAATTVRAPFVISPNVLTAAAPGDEFEVNVGVANSLAGSGPDAEITLSVTASEHLELVGKQRVVVAIDEGDEDRATFRFRATDTLGAADIRFEARHGAEYASTRATLSVRPPVAYVATMQSGHGNDDPLELSYPRTLYTEFAKQDVAASASPLVLVDGLLAYLDAFPHACAEQIVSKVFPQLGLLAGGDESVDQTEIRRMFQASIAKLRSRQAANGGFRFWATSRQAADFPSVYILHFLSDAAEYSVPVPNDMLAAGLGFLRELAAREVQTLEAARVRAYAIYVLTRNGVVTTNYLTNLHEYLQRTFKDRWRDDIAASYMAASYALLKQARLADGLIGEYAFGGGVEMNSDFDTRLGRDAQYLYLLARHFPERMARLDATIIEGLAEPVMQNRFNTLSSAYTILALGAWSRAVFDDTGVEVSIATGQADTLRVLAEANRFARARITSGVREVSIGGASGRDVYYLLTQTGFDRSPPQTALAEGLELRRDYLDADGKVVTEAKIGDELTVRLRVRSTGRPRSNVAVVDLLPGGFEVAADSIERQYRGWAADHVDVREDRVVVYGTFSDRVTEIRYRAKLTSAGHFTAPSAFADSMYDRSVQARTKPGRFEVKALP